jgi:hypothetical protein
MLFCKYCEDRVNLTKNPTRETVNESVDLTVKKFPSVFVNKIKANANNFVNTDIEYNIKWNETEIDSMDIRNVFRQIRDYTSTIRSEDQTLEEMKKYRDQVIKMKNIVKMFFFHCSTCEKYYHLEPGTIVESVNYDQKNMIYDEVPDIRKCDQTLMRTKDFKCPNTSCINNTKHDDVAVMRKKEAVLYKLGNAYNIKYICCQCSTKWGT